MPRGAALASDSTRPLRHPPTSASRLTSTYPLLDNKRVRRSDRSAPTLVDSKLRRLSCDQASRFSFRADREIAWYSSHCNASFCPPFLSACITPVHVSHTPKISMASWISISTFWSWIRHFGEDKRLYRGCPVSMSTITAIMMNTSRVPCDTFSESAVVEPAERSTATLLSTSNN